MTSPFTHPLGSRAAMTMVLVDPAAASTPLATALPGVVDRLAQSLASELGDATWVLHVIWAPSSIAPQLPPGTPPSEIRVPTSTPDVGLFVHDALQEFSDTWGIAFDQVLVETSGINPSGSLDADMWWAMDGLDCTASVDYLIDAPAQWFELPTTLGLLPAAVNAQPVALLAPLPEAHLVRTLLIELLDILSAANPAQEALDWWTDAFATNRFGRWLRRWRAIVSQVYGSDRFVPPPWPFEAVRLRFEGDPSIVSGPDETNAASYARWGRALTDRRVGVALGGAGAQSYVTLPFIEQLLDAGVPIDVLAGASTGAFAAAFYAALGERGLTRMLFNSNTIGYGVFFAFVSNFPLTWWLAWGTHFVDLSEVEQPVIAVSSVAGTGASYYQTAGLAGKGMMASGSQPPFASTYIGNKRLLDGGLTDDLPSAILQAAGAELILAAQVIPKVFAVPQVPSQIPIPFPTKLAVTLNPLVRTFDFMRGYFMVFRQAAQGSEQYAQVSYAATTKLSNAGSWYAGPRIAYEAAQSSALKDAVIAAKAEWDALLGLSPGRVRIDLASGNVLLGSALAIGLETDPTGQWRLSPDAEFVLAQVGQFVSIHAATLEITLYAVPPPSAAEYEPLFLAATGLPATQLTFLIATAPGSPTFDARVIL
jgi:predicted acylesterase/phospholipase RssA